MQFCFASVILLVHLVFKLEKARIIGLLMRVCELGTFGMCLFYSVMILGRYIVGVQSGIRWASNWLW